MAKTTQEVVVFPASGGLQSANNPALIDFKNLKDCNNIIFTNDASRKTRPGLKLFEVSGIEETSNFQFLFDHWRLNTTSGSQNNKVVAIVNGKVYADGGGDGVFTDITGSFIIPPTDTVTADVFGGLLCMAFENAPVKKYNHSGNIENLGGTPPDGAIFRTYRGYPWIGRVRTRPHTIYRGAFEDPETWSGSSTESISIEEGDGDPDGVNAMFPPFYGDMYVAKRRSIYRVRLNDSGIFTVELFLRGVGCVSHNSVAALQNDIIFCSERGVHSLASTQKYGDAETFFLSAPIHDIYTEEMDFTRASKIQGVYIPKLNSYLMTFPRRGGTYSKDVLGYNIVTGQWYRWKDVNAQVCTTFVDSKKQTQLILGDKDGNIAVLDTTQRLDYGTTAITTSFDTGIIYPMGSPKRSVSFKALTVIYRPQGNSEFDCTYSIDGNEIETLQFSQEGKSTQVLGNTFILGAANLSFVGQVKVATKKIKGSGRGIELSFLREPSGDHIRQGMEILGYIIEFKDAEDSGESSVQ